jgi:hypothetical protein
MSVFGKKARGAAISTEEILLFQCEDTRMQQSVVFFCADFEQRVR